MIVNTPQTWVRVSEARMVAQSKRVVMGIGVLLLATFACQPTGAATPTMGEERLGLTVTSIVQTLSAQESATPVVVTATLSTAVIPTATEPPPVVSETASPIVVPPTLTFTAASSIPMVSVTVGTNCRTGPGRVYDLVGGAEVGVRFLIVGRYSPDYWIIRLPDGRECWLWGEHAIVEGDVQSLPEFAAPPTPTPPPALGTVLVTVKGPVRSGDNGALIQNATVIFTATGEQAEPVGEGLYRFRNVALGLKEVRAGAPDYGYGYGSVNVVGGAEPSRVEIYVQWTSRRLDECARLPTFFQRRNCYMLAPFPSQLAPLP